MIPARTHHSSPLATALVALALVAAPVPAAAQLQLCWFQTTPSVNFGRYDPLSPSPTDTVTTVSWSCLFFRPRILIGTGTCGSDASNRCMRGPADRLRYNLYQDANRTQIWPSTGGSTRFPSSGQTSIYARIAAGQDVGAGAYSDTVTITLQL